MDHQTSTKCEHWNGSYRKDYFFRFLFHRLAGGSAITAVFIYFLASFVGMYVIGYFSGHFHGVAGLAPMYESVTHNINFGVFVPLGILLLCYFYQKTSSGFSALLIDGVIIKKEIPDYEKILLEADGRFNNSVALWFCILASVAINIYAYFLKTGVWHCIDGGPVGIYATIFKIVNHFYVFYIAWKGVVTIITLRKILNLNITIRPFHPDNSGGLRAVGQIALAVSYFMALVVIYVDLFVHLRPFLFHKPAFCSLNYHLLPDDLSFILLFCGNGSW